LFILLPGIGSSAQVIPTPKYLDPTRDPSTLRPAPTTSLAEQFIWTADDAAALNPAYQATVRGQNDKTAPHTFRAHFEVKEVPPQATMYVAGPRSATVFLNGKKVLRFDDDPKAGRGFHVKTANVAEALDRGENVIAIQEVRGHNSLHTGAAPIMNQVTYGEVLLVKIVPRGIAENAPPLLISDTHWRSTLHGHKSKASEAPAAARTSCSGTWTPAYMIGQATRVFCRTCGPSGSQRLHSRIFPHRTTHPSFSR
jgi:hypothetical protein